MNVIRVLLLLLGIMIALGCGFVCIEVPIVFQEGNKLEIFSLQLFVLGGVLILRLIHITIILLEYHSLIIFIFFFVHLS
jgi:hypothetical protein